MITNDKPNQGGEILPIGEMALDGDPAAVLTLMADLVTLATALGIDTIHPSDLVVGDTGRLALVPSSRRSETSVATAPELDRSGPTPATLIFAAGAIGAVAMIGRIGRAPSDAAGHARWLQDLTRRIEARWGHHASTGATLGWVTRCLSLDPFARPNPNELLDALSPERAGVRTPITRATSRSLTLSRSSAQRAGPPADRRTLLALTVVAAWVLAMGLATCGVGTVVGGRDQDPPPQPSVQAP